VQVLELDLAAQDVDITRHDHARSLRILLRVRGAPAGWLRLHDPGQVDRAELVHLATVRLGDNTLAVALRDNLSPDFELPPVSVAVCTRERQQSLQRCIESLIALDYPRFEIIHRGQCAHLGCHGGWLPPLLTIASATCARIARAAIGHGTARSRRQNTTYALSRVLAPHATRRGGRR
jgi:hypothetical protein